MKNLNQLLKILENKQEIKVTSSFLEDNEILIIYSENISDIKEFNHFYFPHITSKNINHLKDKFPGIVKIMNESTLDEILKHIYNGEIFFYHKRFQYSFNLLINNTRAIEQSKIDPIDLFSSQDGLVENIETNIGLIRKYLKSDTLNIEYFNLPSESNYRIAILDMNDKKYNQTIKEKLSCNYYKSINTINTINKVFQNNILFPMTLSTSSPQNVASSILKGKTAIILENSPVASIVPVNLFFFTTMKNDLNTPKFYSILTRSLLIVFLLTSVFLLGFYVSLVNFHTSTLTIYGLSNLKISERGTSLPLFLEIMIILVLFELYRFATSRSSNGFIQNVIIFLGGLFIGQNAIKSGLIGPLILLLTSICYLSTYAFTNNLHMVTSLSICRIIILSFSYIFGLYGFIISSTLIFIYLLNIKSFDTNYFFDIYHNSTRKALHFFAPKEPKNEEN